MAARPVRNTQYIPQITLDARYVPVIRRGSKQAKLCMRQSFPTRRNLGDTNIDLWTDGGIYSIDPLTRKPPPLKTLKEFLEFICHGKQGLQEYTYRLLHSGVDSPTSLEKAMDMQCKQLSEEVVMLRGEAAANNTRTAQDLQMERMRCVDLEKTCTVLRAKLHTLRVSHAKRVEQLEKNVRTLEIMVDA